MKQFDCGCRATERDGMFILSETCDTHGPTPLKGAALHVGYPIAILSTQAKLYTGVGLENDETRAQAEETRRLLAEMQATS